MKYLAYSLILIAFSASMFGQSKTAVEVGYSHYEATADPKNGQSCLAGTAFCVGGGTTTSVIPSPDGCIPPKTLVTVTPGTYSNFNKELDSDLSTLTSVVYTIRRKSDNAILYTETISRGAGWPTVPTDFLADLKVAPFTVDVIGKFYYNGNGILFITSPSIPGSAASNSETLIVSIDPSCSPIAGVSGSTYTSVGGVDETFTQEYTATAIAAMSKFGKLIPGDVKYSELDADHDGWYKLDGRAIASISNISAKTVASTLYSGTLPNMSNKYFYAEHANADRLTYDGQNNFTVANNNIQAATLATTTNGAHSHSFVDYFYSEANGGPGGYLGSGGSDFDNNPTSNFTHNTDTAGDHNHNVTIGTGSPSSIDNRPVSKRMYAYVYLGE